MDVDRPAGENVNPLRARNEVDPLRARNEIVMRIMEINSEELRCDTEHCGLEMEMLTAQNSIECGASITDGARATLNKLQERVTQLAKRRKANLEERENLCRVLSELDAVDTNTS